MSVAGLTSIALFAPVVASNAIFSARRASRGVDAIDNNPLFALANFDIAAAQILKGGRAAKGLALAVDPTLEFASKGAAETIKATSTTNKILKGVGKVINFTADNINPIIIGAGVLKVAGAEDKLDEAARESTSLLCMFGAEAVTKDFVGMPITKKINGKSVSFKREGSYKKLFSEKQLKAIQDYCATKKGMKMAAGGAKGLLFVGASIAGYQIGNKIADVILGEEKQSA